MTNYINKRQEEFFVSFGEVAEKDGNLYADLKAFHKESLTGLVERIRQEIVQRRLMLNKGAGGWSENEIGQEIAYSEIKSLLSSLTNDNEK